MPFAEAADQIDYASTAFVILCASLVLLMTTPGLALFYGGMTRTKSILNMMMMSFGAMGVVGIIYVLYGYSMSFGSENIAGIIANPFQHFGLSGTPTRSSTPSATRGTATSPSYAFVGFQLTFAVITVALISGAVADRVKFSTWLVFCALWVTFSYFPIAHMVWGGGLLSGQRDSLSSLDLRLDRRHGQRHARSTSPVAPSSTSTPVWPAWCSRSSSASGSASARSRCARTTCRSR